MKQVQQIYTIQAPVDKVWQAFVDPAVIEQWGGGPAQMSALEGSDFSLWGGDIFGTNTRVVERQLLQQDWYSGEKWPQPSKVNFMFRGFGPQTTIQLTHTDIPDDATDIEQGWQDYYINPIKELLEPKVAI